MKTSLGRRFRRLLGYQPQWQLTQLLDRTVVAWPGIVRATADYDDAWLVACARRARVAMDIGANQGQAALMMLVANPRLRVLSIDANATALAIAAEHLIRNQLSLRAAFVESFVGASDDEEVTFYTVSAGAAGSMYSTHAATAAKANRSIQVRTVTVDTLARQTETAPDFIKVDIEGAEALALDGMRETVCETRPRIMVEMHSNVDLPMQQNAQRVLDWCRSTDYRAWYLRDKVELTESSHVASRGRCHLLLQPKSEPFPTWLEPISQGAPISTGLLDEATSPGLTN